MKRLFRAAFIFGVFALLIAATALADDRINMPPYHFGGNTLFCDSENGCALLDLNGQFLWNWSQADIAAAFEELDMTGKNTLVGEGQGTYGAAWLWVIPTSATNGNKTLCLQGFDEWGKQNVMCFDVTTDWIYQPAPLPINAEPAADCSAFGVGDSVHRIGTIGSISFGEIVEINTDAGTVVVDMGRRKGLYTASCDAIEHYMLT
jgi:hypothetical protein